MLFTMLNIFATAIILMYGVLAWRRAESRSRAVWNIVNNLRILMDFFTGHEALTIPCLFLVLCQQTADSYRVDSACSLSSWTLEIEPEDEAAYPIIFGDQEGERSLWYVGQVLKMLVLLVMWGVRGGCRQLSRRYWESNHSGKNLAEMSIGGFERLTLQ